MEENQTEEKTQVQEETSNPAPEVGFPLSQPKPKVKMNKWFLIVIGLLILGGGGVYFFTRGAGEEIPTPTPNVGGIATSTPAPTPTATPADKSTVKIEVQNGTGVTGEAAYLQGVLKNLGYTNVEVGNAEDQDQTKTTVTFSRDLSSLVKDEITKKLKEVYKEVDVKTSSTLKVNVLIVTGLRKGATPKPTPTKTPTPTATPTPTTTATPEPTG